jgi:hypothetical protein
MPTSTCRSDRCPTCNQRRRRRIPQNALYWALLHEMAANLAPGGVSYSAEQYHTYYKSRFLGCDDVKLPNGKTLAIPHSTADLDVAAFSAYFEQVQADAAERGIFLDSMEGLQA